MIVYFVALEIVFGSLYKDYIDIKPVEVVGVLAAAILLQLVSVHPTSQYFINEEEDSFPRFRFIFFTP